jgi:hypothetical protein
VVLHDFDLLRAFPNKGPNVAAYQQLAQHGIRPPPVSVRIQVRHNATNLCLCICFFHVRMCNLTAQLCTLRTARRKSLYLPTNLSLPHLLLPHALRMCPVRSCAHCTLLVARPLKSHQRVLSYVSLCCFATSGCQRVQLRTLHVAVARAFVSLTNPYFVPRSLLLCYPRMSPVRTCARCT